MGFESQTWLLIVEDRLRSLGAKLQAARLPGHLDTLNATLKLDGTVVSQADLLAHRILNEIFSELFPGEILISEEDAASLSALPSLLRSGRGWIMDPLDNSRGYVSGASNYSILLTRMQSGRATDALLLFPATNLFLSAGEGSGCFAQRVRQTVSCTRSLASARMAHIYGKESNLTTIPSPPEESTEAIVAVCCGELDVVFIEVCGHKIWDVAFASLLLYEAGGKLTDEHGNPIRLTSEDVSVEWLVASNGYIHHEALRALREYLRASHFE